MIKRVPIRDGELATWDSGTGDAILLVHGYPLSHRMWANVIPALSANYRVLAPDLRGFGNSTPLGPTSMAQMADDLSAYLDHLAIPSLKAFVGLSMGGYVGFEFWDRFASRMQSFVLCDTKAESDSLETASLREQSAKTVHQRGTKATVEGMLPRLVHPSVLENAKELIADLTEMMFATAEQTIANAQRAMAARRSFVDRLGDIEMPTLIIVGEQDIISTASEMKGIADRIPGAVYRSIPDCGHMSPMEQPQAFSDILTDFLRTLSSDRATLHLG